VHIDSPEIKAMLEARTAVVVDKSVIGDFDKFICLQPWLPTSIDWRFIPHESFRLSGDDCDDAIRWLESTVVGRNSHLVAVYARDEPGLLCTIREAVRSLGPLFRRAPGKRFLFGALSDGPCLYRFEDFVEFDGGERLTVPTKPAIVH
jgi:hypothetical protein